MELPTLEATIRMHELCGEKYEALVNEGCDAGVALDRVCDCYDLAYSGSVNHCADPRDRAFEDQLREVAHG